MIRLFVANLLAHRKSKDFPIELSDVMDDSVILVTGAAGFVGSRLAKRLLSTGHCVVGIDNLHDYYSLDLKQNNLKDLRSEDGFTFIEMDIREPVDVSRLFDDYKIAKVAHLAAMAAVRYSAKYPLIYGTVNVQGTANLLDAARQHGNPPCVLASTGSVYGADTPVPFKEDAAAAHPLAPYPASKRAMELFAHAFNHLYKLDVTILRFFNVYGPHGRPDMMPWQWTRQILAGEPLTLYGAGKLKRDWTFIDDILAGFTAALEKPMGFEIMNLGCANPVENIEFVHTLERLLEKKAQIIDTPTPASEPPFTYADVSRAKRLLGYEPKVNVAEGLRRFIDWLRANRLMEGLS
ncbi:MAG: GDP-mannose 4,6-dehydratase [Tepidisphaeraceae bacterium]